ncbi:MAG: hypothetical protein OK454_00305 [Thaumarchaeota archaeon]|nr:hypothetical protein [Nitrososphaerota archaeon]
MNSRLVVSLSVVVIVLLAGTFFVVMQLGAASSTESQSSTSVGTSESYLNASQNLQLRLSVNASSTGGSQGNVTVSIRVDEYNTLATANNVSKATQWGLDGLSLGACGTQVYPFGVALYSGTYTAANVSKAEPLQIYPVVPCPMLLRLITAYLFQPASDLAVVLPSGPNATATPMSANVTATAVYMTGSPSSSPSPLGPGTYTVAAGDEWGSVVVTHLTVGAGTGASSTSTGTSLMGTLEASFSIGPTQPVCSADSMMGPAPSTYSSIEAVVTPSPSGQATNFPIVWNSNSCEVSASVQASLAPGSYSLSLSSCTFMGCASALPRSFVIVAGQSTSVDVSIDTGIR